MEERIMIEYKISYCGDTSISDMHHIGIDYNGEYFSVVFGSEILYGGIEIVIKFKYKNRYN